MKMLTSIYRWASLVSAILFIAHGPIAAEQVIEERVEHAGGGFRVVRVEPERLEVVWKDDKGTAYRSFDKVQEAYAAKGRTVRFLMNGGIFQMGGTPCGLHIENGRILHPLNLKDDEGNFYLKPNGVCWIERNGNKLHAMIAESSSYQKHSAAKKGLILSAVQSGPLLLIDGVRHPSFREGSANKLHRNGVGIDANGRLVFAITDKDQWVNLWDFAGLFLKLGCQQALFLDGDISKMVCNPVNPVQSNQFGAMFVISEPKLEERR
jgi:uncharacterized protein YigE (DUF2233 family)